MMEERTARVTVLVALPLIVLAFFIVSSGHFAYSPDDTYIYLQFAKNFTHGGGMAFNAGEPTYGFTSPLWLLLISAGGKVGADLYIAAKGIDLVFAGCALLVFYLLAVELIRETTVALLATLGFSMNIWLLRWAGAGMETSLSVCLVLATVLYCLRNEYLLSMVMAGLLTLVRPEGVVIVPLLLIDIVLNSVEKRQSVHTMLVALPGYAVVVIPWLLTALGAFGTVMPNTARAKGGIHTGAAGAVESVWNQAKIAGASDGLGLAVLAATTVILLVALRQEPREYRSAVMRQSFVAGAMLCVLPVVYLLSGATVQSRYLLLALPFVGLLAFAHLYRVLRSSRWSRFSFAGVIVLAAGMTLQSQVAYWGWVKPGIDEFAAGVQSSLVPIGRYMRENVPAGEKVFAWDIGVIGYASDRTIVDGFGLATPEMIPLLRAGYGPDRVMREGLYRTFPGVGYVLHRSTLRDEWASADLTPVVTKEFSGLRLRDAGMHYYTLYKINR